MELAVAFSELDDVVPRAEALRFQLAKASGVERNARAFCVAGDVKKAKKSFKGSLKTLGRVRALLASKAAKTIPGRTELLATVDQLRRDVRSLRSTVSCPNGAL